MQHTLTLRLTNTPSRPEVARQFVVAVAVRAGLSPLAADRAAARVEHALAEDELDTVELAAGLEESQVHLELSGGGAAWCAALAAALAPLGAAAGPDAVELTLQRTPLHSV